MNKSKMWAAIVSGFISTLIVQPVDMNPWIKAVLVSIGAGIIVYLAPKNSEPGT